MKLLVSMHLRDGRNTTNFRCEAVAAGLKAAGATIVEKSRGQLPDFGTDLVLQTGLGTTPALMTAVSSGVPYIVAENPLYRHLPEVTQGTWVSWGYNGLTGGAFHPKTPSEVLWTPPLEPLKEEGETIIFCQKLNDHSIRDSDHEVWIEKMMEKYPDAIVRPHPIMIKERITPIKKVLDECYEAITYTSTVGAEALINGCVSKPYHWGSAAFEVTDREEWMHDLSWKHFTKEFMASIVVGRHILSGFEEARELARRGVIETPHPRAQRMVWEYNQNIRDRIENVY